jgi:hypothetical protein
LRLGLCGGVFHRKLKSQDQRRFLLDRKFPERIALDPEKAAIFPERAFSRIFTYLNKRGEGGRDYYLTGAEAAKRRRSFSLIWLDTVVSFWIK